MKKPLKQKERFISFYYSVVSVVESPVPPTDGVFFFLLNTYKAPAATAMTPPTRIIVVALEAEDSALISVGSVRLKS